MGSILASALIIYNGSAASIVCRFFPCMQKCSLIIVFTHYTFKEANVLGCEYIYSLKLTYLGGPTVLYPCFNYDKINVFPAGNEQGNI